METYLLRSLLFVPGHNKKLLQSASRSDADAIIIDLEDSVPKSNKAMARKVAFEKLEEGLFRDRLVFVRINRGEDFNLDIDAFASSFITGFVLPKVEWWGNINEFDHKLKAIETKRGLILNSLKIIPLIETTCGVLHALGIALASSRVIAVAFGSEDYIADLEGVYQPCPKGTTFNTPRAIIAMSARAAKIIPIDTVYPDISDLSGFDTFVSNSRSLGFEGSLILHPKQIPAAHRAYSPSQQEIQKAQEIFELAERAEAEGKGVAYFEGRFVGPPLVKAAKKIIARDNLIQARCKNGI